MKVVRTLKTPARQVPERRTRLEALARRVAADARQDPKAYREESRVPAGGE